MAVVTTMVGILKWDLNRWLKIKQLHFAWYESVKDYDKYVTVNMAWCIPRFWMEERPTIRRVDANILKKHSGTSEKVWSYILGIGRGVNNSSTQKCNLLRNIHTESLGPGLIICYDLSNEKGILDLVLWILGKKTKIINLGTGFL